MKAWCVLLKDVVLIVLAVVYALGYVGAGCVLLTWYWVVGAVLLTSAVIDVLALLFGVARLDGPAWERYRVRPGVWRTLMRVGALVFFAWMGQFALAAVLLVLLLLIQAIHAVVDGPDDDLPGGVQRKGQLTAVPFDGYCAELSQPEVRASHLETAPRA
jgi:hypothetical protein